MSYYPRVSYHSLLRWEKCQEFYRLHRDGRYVKPDQTIFIVGNVLDGLLGLMAARKLTPPPSVSWVELAVRDFDRRVAEIGPRWTGERTTESERERVIAGAQRQVLLLEDLGMEAQWTTALGLRVGMGGWMMDGELDVLIMRGVWEWEVWDLKTGTTHSQDQLVFYDILLGQIGMRPERTGFIEPLGRGLVDVPIIEEERVTMKERIAACARGIAACNGANAVLWPTTGYKEKCGWCSAKPFCSRWEAARRGTLMA